MDSSKKDSTLSIDITPVFRAQRSLEHEGRSNSNSPSKGKFSCLSRFVLVDSEGGIDTSSVDLLTLFVQTTNGRSHSLRADGDDVHILGEILTNRFKVSEQKSVGKSKGGTGLHGSEDLLVQSSLCGVTDEKHDQITLSNNVVHLSKGVSILAESNLTGLLEGRGSLTKSDADLDVASGLIEGVAEVLGLGWGLGSPSDDTNFLDALEGFGEKGEEITSSLNNLLFGVSERNISDIEDGGREGVEGRAGGGDRRTRGNTRGKGSRRCSDKSAESERKIHRLGY
eukprot:245268_1